MLKVSWLNVSNCVFGLGASTAPCPVDFALAFVGMVLRKHI